MPPISGPEQLLEVVRAAARRPEVRAAVRVVYEELGRRIEQRRPVCRASGRCCRFEEFGHRLYVTTLELAVFYGELEEQQKPPGEPEKQGGSGGDKGVRLPVLPAGSAGMTGSAGLQAAGGQAAWDGTGCPYQVEGLCSVHAIRPFGCRIFFCDETSTDWQQAQYEALHTDLKRLHEELGVAYAYLEWREGLRILGLARRQPEL